MKRRIKSLALALSVMLALIPAAVLAAPDDVINFPDPNFEAEIRFMLDKPTGPITKSDVAQITHLHCNAAGRTISDFSGIEYFTALTVFQCSGNQLTELDVSRNTALTSLVCSGNQLTKLDVSNLTALTLLQCSGNQITMLDVSKNTALKYLDCGANQLTQLDVSNLTALTALYCNVNQLTELDVSNLTALTEFWCDQNQLTKLDVSKNTKLTTFNCAVNQLAELEAGNLTALEDFFCNFNQLAMLDLSGKAELTMLYCDNNQLTSLDVSDNTALKWLICTNNIIPDKSAITGLDESRLDGFQFIPQRLPGLYAPNLNTAAQWAWVEIVSAVTKGFVPEDIQNNYLNVITRQEFCRMAVMFAEYALGEDIEDILDDKGLSRDPDAFSDTEDAYILAAFALGITNGTKEPTETQPGEFTPDGQFSRQEAATMLMRVCRAIGMDTDDPPASDFTDLGAAETWALDGINFVRARGIMNGKSVSKPFFDPRGTYTRQESIATFDRISAVSAENDQTPGEG